MSPSGPSNSRVRLTTQKQVEFATADEGFAAGASVCQQLANGHWGCWLDNEPVEFVNFNSEGFTIDKIAYAPTTH